MAERSIARKWPQAVSRGRLALGLAAVVGVASAAAPMLANRSHGRWEVAVPSDVSSVMFDGKARSVTGGRIALDRLSAGNHTIEIGTRPATTLIIRESGSQSTDPGETSTHEFAATVEDPKLRRPGPTLRVMQGDMVQFDVSSAEPVEVHLHGYDIEGNVGPNKPLSIAFDANLAGRFSFETHGAVHNSFAYLEVLPR